MRRILTASVAFVLLLSGGIELCACPEDRPDGMRAGAAERDISPPVGMEILHYFRKNIGVHDPLFLRALVLEDAKGTSFALITVDLICAGFVASDELRDRVKKATGVTEVWLNCSHNHSSRWLNSIGGEGQKWTDERKWDEYRDRPISESPEEAKWNRRVHQIAAEVVSEAKRRLEPVTLSSGRARVQVGFNRRVARADGSVRMAVNKSGAIAPWVSVLVAHRRGTKIPVAVLFEHAAHPVTVPHTSRLVSADFPGAAVARIREKLGKDVVALFGQGCCGNINSFPLRSSHADADRAGRRLGDAVIEAMGSLRSIDATTMTLRHERIELPTRELPSAEVVADLRRRNQNRPERIKQLDKIDALRKAGGTPPPRRFDVNAVMLGEDWCLIGMSYETFVEYELWIDKHAPFRDKMVFALTNGGRAYIGTDAALALGPKGGYEAGCLPNWGAHESMSPSLGPPAVGAEKRIHAAFRSLWSDRSTSARRIRSTSAKGSTGEKRTEDRP